MGRCQLLHYGGCGRSRWVRRAQAARAHEERLVMGGEGTGARTPRTGTDDYRQAGEQTWVLSEQAGVADAIAGCMCDYILSMHGVSGPCRPCRGALSACDLLGLLPVTAPSILLGTSKSVNRTNKPSQQIMMVPAPHAFLQHLTAQAGCNSHKQVAYRAMRHTHKR